MFDANAVIRVQRGQEFGHVARAIAAAEPDRREAGVGQPNRDGQVAIIFGDGLGQRLAAEQQFVALPCGERLKIGRRDRRDLFFPIGMADANMDAPRSIPGGEGGVRWAMEWA
ncbi:hypothetical protein HL653_21460 [Sphingomonas sp. AP4-R1]|uniref:hypothetical protein n=1 Tax=Sphingomonas sp. AP4-R1 TaxID=2735134 RepID=UPI00149340B2|nr:hypothetical protein [Sphingomonas sp. AP4-R1]QJU59971.1 hypothetical protein HL653_21460 [Sphingomonas sp. AP4-R1]